MGGEEGAIGADRGSSLEFESPGEARLVYCDGRAYIQSQRLSLRKLGVHDLEGGAAVESRSAWRTGRRGTCRLSILVGYLCDHLSLGQVLVPSLLI